VKLSDLGTCKGCSIALFYWRAEERSQRGRPLSSD